MTKVYFSTDDKSAKKTSLLESLKNMIKPTDHIDELLNNSQVKLDTKEDLSIPDNFEDEETEWVEMFNKETGEWNGPRNGEPTKFGDWQQKGRTTDFS